MTSTVLLIKIELTWLASRVITYLPQTPFFFLLKKLKFRYDIYMKYNSYLFLVLNITILPLNSELCQINVKYQ